MNTTGKVFSLLVGTANVALLAKGKKVDELADGQIGVFNSDTNLSLEDEDLVGSSKPANIFFAVNNKGVITMSAGQDIQVPLIVGLTGAKAKTGQEHIVDIIDYAVECETDYAVKVEFRSGLIYQRQGYVPYTKTYAARTGCCDNCESEDCNTGNKYKLTKDLYEEILINSVDDKLTPKIIIKNETSNLYEIKTIEDLVEAEADGLDVGIRLIFGADDINPGQVINTSYTTNRQRWGIVTLVDGFGCSGKTVTTQTATPGEGLGYDLRQKEYFAKGWQNGPYRTYAVTGLPKPVTYVTVEDTKYNVLSITHNFYSEAGWLEYSNELATIFAIPQANTTATTSLKEIFVALGQVRGIPFTSDIA